MGANVRPKNGKRFVFGALFLSTGAALVIYIISGISLPAALLLVLLAATIMGVYLFKKSKVNSRHYLYERFKVGLLSGFLATLAYDGSRYLLIELTGISFWPFDIFTVFGQALLGAGYTGLWVTVAGVLYHLLNGVGFGIAYTIWAGEKGIWAGILWAFALEVCMVSIYPGWLNINAFREFIDVSVLGHVVYGIVLGYTAKKCITKKWFKNG
ncbi:MAG: hypothetical protein AB3N18_03750 [Allomuricauda sp.]